MCCVKSSNIIWTHHSFEQNQKCPHPFGKMQYLESVNTVNVCLKWVKCLRVFEEYSSWNLPFHYRCWSCFVLNFSWSPFFTDFGVRGTPILQIFIILPDRAFSWGFVKTSLLPILLPILSLLEWSRNVLLGNSQTRFAYLWLLPWLSSQRAF